MASMLLLYGIKGKLWYASERRRLLRRQQSTDRCLLDDDTSVRCGDNAEGHEMLSFEDVLHRLRNNELSVLHLGGKNSNYFSDHHQHSLMAALERAIHRNVSLRSVYLGWRLPHGCLLRILHTMTYESGIPLHQLRHLEIAVLGQDHHRIPDTLLTDLFLRQQKLVSIHLRSIQMDTKPPEQHPSLSAAVFQKTRRHPGAASSPLCSRSVVTHCILQQYQRLNCLRSLSLVDCDVTGDIAMELAQFLHIRGGIADLSLRSNRTLSGPGLRLICQAPVMRRLDLSLCDLDGLDAVAVADGIASRSWPLEEMALAGNYRIDAMGLRALLQPSCCQKMMSLDLSYCAVSSDQMVSLFEALESLEPEHCLLRRLVLRGSAMTNDAIVTALETLLQSDCPLRYLDLTDPQDPKPFSWHQLCRIAGVMEHNYELEELYVDYEEKHLGAEHYAILKKLTFYLQLNKAGRRILRVPRRNSSPSSLLCALSSHDPLHSIRITKSEDNWFGVLERAGKEDNLDVLNWIVRNSSGQYFQRRFCDYAG